jgi:CBS-domain-containing membrane protein
MRLIDGRLKENRKHFVLQSLAGTVLIMLLLSIANIIDSAVVVASIGSSVFVGVSSPHAPTSRARYFIGGYLCGCAAGLVGFALETFIPSIPQVFIAALAVGAAFLLMVCFDLEHPPAAALALGLVLSPYTLATIVVALACVCLLSLALHICRPWMEDLL